MYLTIVRHGQSQGNLEGRWQGQSDFPLTEQGRHEARLAAERLAKQPDYDVLYSSDLSRARETAEIIGSKLALPLKHLPDAREYGFGLLEGHNKAELAEQYPELFRNLEADFNRAEIPGAEGPGPFRARIERLLANLLSQHQGQRVILVSHGRLINALLVVFLEMDYDQPWPFRLGNTGFSSIEFAQDGGKRVYAINDCAHLEAKSAADGRGFEEQR